LKLRWRRRAREDYENWHQANVPVWKKINGLIHSIQQNPERGLGRPKALQYDLDGWWARQITKRRHRLVYRIRKKGGKAFVEILKCRGHYND